MKHLSLSPAERISGVRIVLAIGMIAGLLLSMHLWIGERLFPLAPVIQNLPPIPGFLEVALFATLIALLCGILITKKTKILILGALSIAATFALFDQMRWQPWFYQYCFMLATIGFLHSRKKDQGNEAVLNTLRLIVASLYIVSGLQKINPAFPIEIFPYMVLPIAKLFPQSSYPIFLALGILVPFVEIGIGIGLLTKRGRTPAVILALCMLVFVLFTLGPWGHNWNSIVWPWNVAMALFVILLFYEGENFSSSDVLWVKHFPFHKIILILFALMPFFSFFDLWDSYLSSALYSGNTAKAEIHVSDSVRANLPSDIAQYVIENEGEDTHTLDFFQWSIGELNVPPYPEPRIYKIITRSLCAYAEDPQDVILIVKTQPTVFHRSITSRTYNCSDL